MDSQEFDHFYQRPRFWIILFLIAALLLGIRFCTSTKTKKKPVSDIPVVAAMAHTANIPDYIYALGTVTPIYTVTVKTQINGIMRKVFFKEGEFVKADQLLAQIDPRPYEAQLIEYQGQIARDQALLKNALRDLARYKKLWAQNSISQQTYQTQASLVEQYQGTVKLDQGLINTTLVNLIYCKITSPIDGRIGLRFVDPGNLVQTTDTTGIALITSVNPIEVVFPIPEDYIPEVFEQFTAKKTLKVEAYDRQQKKLLATGSLITIDNQINTSTGTINLKAGFENADNKLFANQFVNIKLLVKTLENAIVVPTAAIQYRSQGTFIYLIDANNKIVQQKITVGLTQGDETQITQGVSVGQTVVIEGTDNLKPGTKVLITNTKEIEKQKTAEKNKTVTPVENNTAVIQEIKKIQNEKQIIIPGINSLKLPETESKTETNIPDAPPIQNPDNKSEKKNKTEKKNVSKKQQQSKNNQKEKNTAKNKNESENQEIVIKKIITCENEI